MFKSALEYYLKKTNKPQTETTLSTRFQAKNSFLTVQTQPSNHEKQPKDGPSPQAPVTSQLEEMKDAAEQPEGILDMKQEGTL